jgi:hypothetical protein
VGGYAELDYSLFRGFDENCWIKYDNFCEEATFLSSPSATQAILSSGLEPITHPANSQAKPMTNDK